MEPQKIKGEKKKSLLCGAYFPRRVIENKVENITCEENKSNKVG